MVAGALHAGARLRLMRFPARHELSCGAAPSGGSHLVFSHSKVNRPLPDLSSIVALRAGASPLYVDVY
jgi:hypothetical protein